MTLSPEERAWAVALDINSDDDGYEMAEKIAPAIRQACNEKLEEAERRLKQHALVLLPPQAQLVAKCAATVGSFKFKDTSP
jgi:hypothetical protein